MQKVIIKVQVGDAVLTVEIPGTLQNVARCGGVRVYSVAGPSAEIISMSQG